MFELPPNQRFSLKTSIQFFEKKQKGDQEVVFCDFFFWGGGTRWASFKKETCFCDVSDFTVSS